jgi:hypothetical protein
LHENNPQQLLYVLQIIEFLMEEKQETLLERLEYVFGKESRNEKLVLEWKNNFTKCGGFDELSSIFQKFVKK